MSIQTGNEPVCRSESGAIQLLIEPKAKDLGAFEVRRALPSTDRQRVGPFIFFDHMGPAELPSGAGMDVRPHPHIGIATVTYLFEGEILHRDSLGYEQLIQPGAVNWMTAGSGIVHSERSPKAATDGQTRLHGIQTWLALPTELEESDPDFTHYPANSIPELKENGVSIRLIAGTAFGLESPVRTASETFYAAIEMTADASLVVPREIEERAIYVVTGEVMVGSTIISAGQMGVLTPDESTLITAQNESKLMLLGGARVAGDRHLFWNFVSSRPERIEKAKEDWRNHRFDPVPGDTEFIPLPE